jgi:myosin heavy subunit
MRYLIIVINFFLRINAFHNVIKTLPKRNLYQVSKEKEGDHKDGRSLCLELEKRIVSWKAKGVVLEPYEYDQALELIKEMYQTCKISFEVKINMEQELISLKRRVEKLEAANEKLEAANEKSEAAYEKLEASNEKLEAAYEKLEASNKNLEVSNEKLEAANEKLNGRVEKSEAAKEYLKFLTALQDLNGRYTLEKSMKEGLTKKNFLKLRQSRNEESHFILKDDSEVLKIYKAVAIRDRLDAMSPACADKFTREFGQSFIATVKTHFATLAVTGTVAQDEKEVADEWWTDYIV